MPQVTVKLNPKTSEVEFEVEGVVGGKCTNITEALSAGSEVIAHEYTSEYCMENDLPEYVNDNE